MACHTAKTLVGYDDVPEVVLCDIDVPGATGVSRKVGPKTSVRFTDILDPESLEAAISEADLVLNTSGPFFVLGARVLDACIRLGIPYMDICDDPEPTLDMLSRDAGAKQAGVLALIGVGASPGISNMLAVKAIQALDHTTEIYTVWDLDYARPEQHGKKTAAALLHGIEQLTGTVLAYRNGSVSREKPLEKIWLSVPHGGSGNVYTIGHPESVTLPRYFPELQTSVNAMLVSPTVLWGLKGLCTLVDSQWLDKGRAAAVAQAMEKLDGKPPSPEKISRDLTRRFKHRLPPFFALAKGTSAGRTATSAALIMGIPPGGIGAATGVPLAVAAIMYLRGNISGKGVFAPEAVLDPDTFFRMLMEHSRPQYTQLDDFIVVLKSD